MEVTEYQMDQEAEVSGRWFELPEFGDGTRVKLARWGNRNFNNLVQALSRRYKRDIQRDDLAWEKGKELMEEVVAKTIVKDWEGFTHRGEPLACTPENVLTALVASPEFKDRVMALAQQDDSYRRSVIEELQEDLAKSSAGKSSGASTKKS